MLTFSLEHHPEVESTNTLALQYVRDGRPEGLVITTDFQTAGRGKPGNVWISPRGKNLLFSVLLRPPLPSHKAPILTQVACQAVRNALAQEFNLPVTLKRPNDVLIRGRKICGILTESVSSADGKVEAVVIGVGLNVNASAAELLPTATSLFVETGRVQDRDSLLQKLLDQLAQHLEPHYAPCA